VGLGGEISSGLRIGARVLKDVIPNMVGLTVASAGGDMDVKDA
jgi:hypothetical protein